MPVRKAGIGPVRETINAWLPDPVESLMNLTFGGPEDIPMAPPTPLVSAAPPHLMRMLGKRTLETVEGRGNMSNEAIDALRFAQQKYPRLFGHLTDVTPLEKVREPRGSGIINRIKDLVRPTEKTFGEQVSSPITPKHSRIKLASPTAYERYPQRSVADTLGHELAHAAQTLRSKDFPKKYTESVRTWGYQGSPYELSANISGKKFAEAYNTYKAAQAAQKVK